MLFRGKLCLALVVSTLGLRPESVRADACCLLPVGACADYAPSTCTGFGGVPQGAGTTCSTVDCFAPQACCTPFGCSESSPQDCVQGCSNCRSLGPGTDCSLAPEWWCPPSACCRADGSCSMEHEAACDRWLDGTPVLWTDCASAACPQLAACCLEDGTCLDSLPADCADAGGTLDAGTTCATSACSSLPARACCLPDGTCQEETPHDCVALSGDPAAAGTTCGAAACLPPRACCLLDGTCVEIAPFACLAVDGLPYGPSSSCATISCPQLGACCMTNDTCVDVPPDTCLWWGGTSQGTGSTCASGACGPPPGWVPDGHGRGGTPLRVAKSGPLGALRLSWGASCSAAREDYAVYEGAVGNWYSHEGVACSTGNVRTVTITPGSSTQGRYYLVVPQASMKEGSYGLASFGVERPPSSGPCRPAQDPACR